MNKQGLISEPETFKTLMENIKGGNPDFKKTLKA